MSRFLPVYRLRLVPLPGGGAGWQALPWGPAARAALTPRPWSELLGAIRGAHPEAACVSLLIGTGTVSFPGFRRPPAPGVWLGSPTPGKGTEVVDLFWRADLVPLAWVGSLTALSKVPDDCPPAEAPRAWLLQQVGREDQASFTTTVLPVTRSVPDPDAFGGFQNSLLRQWLDEGYDSESLARIRRREQAWLAVAGQRQEAEFEGLRVQRNAFAPGVGGALDPSPSTEVSSPRVEDEALAAAVARAEHVTLDVFDTVLMRRVGRPVDVFWLLGAELGASTGLTPADFAALRVASEHALRAEVQAAGDAEDVRLEHIYRRLAAELGVSAGEVEAWAQAEQALEARVIRAHPEFVRCSPQLTGKAKLALSEMYLPAALIRQWLDEHGGLAELPVWTSGETGLSKGSGELYRRASEYLAARPEQLLHIGDNPQSDLAAPAALGWRTFPWPRERTCRLDQPVRWRPKDPLGSVAAGLLRAERRPDEPLARQLGFELLGPIAWSWLYHLAGHPQVQSASQVWLLARDGYWVERLWRLLPAAYQHAGERRYVAASRQLWGLAAIEDISERDWGFLLKPAPGLRTRDFLERAGIDSELLPEDPELSWDRVLVGRRGFKEPADRDRLYRLFVRHIAAFHAARQPRRERVLEQLSRLNSGCRPPVVVDLGWHGSSAEHLARLGRSLGWCETPPVHYFATWREAEEARRAGARAHGFFVDRGEDPTRVVLLRESVDLLENLFSAPHPTVVDLEPGGQPRYAAADPRPPAQLETLAELWAGAERFCQSIAELVPEPGMGDPAPLAQRALERLLRFPAAEEAALFAEWRHVEGWGSDRARRLVDPVGSFGASHWPRGWRALQSTEKEAAELSPFPGRSSC